MNIASSVGEEQSLWIDKGADCIFNSDSVNEIPYFVPKINNISLEYESVVRRWSGLYNFIYVITTHNNHIITFC
jgi:hypothetical protein